MLVTAHAKINLGLRILDRRPDGYHNLETVFTRVMPFDEIEFQPADTVTLHCDQPGIPVDASNLVLKAAHALITKYSVSSGARIVLRKRIPSGAGLGGGSSDAAATVLALNRFWNLNASAQQLHDIASTLGSDVPYFLQHGAASATGRGEILTPINLTLPYWIVVVFPGVHVPTPWAYANLPKERGVNRISLTTILSERIGDPASWIGIIDNDFEQPVFEKYPEVRQAREQLYHHGALFAQLSGSGSAVYGIFNRKPETAGLQNAFPANHQVFVTPPGFHTAHPAG